MIMLELSTTLVILISLQLQLPVIVRRQIIKRAHIPSDLNSAPCQEYSSLPSLHLPRNLLTSALLFPHREISLPSAR